MGKKSKAADGAAAKKAKPAAAAPVDDDVSVGCEKRRACE